MATTFHAVKMLLKHAAVRHNGSRYWAEHDGQRVTFFDQQGKAICIRVRRIGDEDETGSDYSAGVFVGNIAQAIRIAGW